MRITMCIGAGALVGSALAALIGGAAAAQPAPRAATVDHPDVAPSRFTVAAHAEAQARRPFSDRRDFEFADRGFVATRADPVIRGTAGQVVWNLAARDFLTGDAPATVDPSLWRHAQLMARHGLFQVNDHIWQVRGFDLSNITFVKGQTGWIIIDALSSVETARAALELVSDKLGKRPIKALIYTHPHLDHYSGAAGLITPEQAASRAVSVIAPHGFLASAFRENVEPGAALQRRAAYQFGLALPSSALGELSGGIGPGIAVGTRSLIAPNREIERTGEQLVIDGVKLVFQLTHGSEAPEELNIDFPEWRTVDLAENANATQHNILTPRGASVRDAKLWADQLTDSIERFGDSDILITSHGWPRFGKAEITSYLSNHRDAYAFLHDQTVRLMNQGLTGDEIAARLELPAALDREWYNRPYYGSLSFNSRAVYQFYMGWYDANPAHLVPRPPADTGRRYVEAIGGAARVLALARAAADRGDYAWAAELLNHLVMSDRGDLAARQLLASCYDQLGWQSENTVWRNIYLTAAGELRSPSAGAGPPPPAGGQAAALADLPAPMLFDILAVRLDPDQVGARKLAIAFVLEGRGGHKETTYLTVKNAVLLHGAVAPPGPLDATVTLPRDAFIASLLGGAPLAAGSAKIEGDPGALARLQSWTPPPRPGFPIVTR
jgi:alkyl sulfatase BDS1-like metallo-beta-lactamase superfamily hydrolase